MNQYFHEEDCPTLSALILQMIVDCSINSWRYFISQVTSYIRNKASSEEGRYDPNVI